MLKGPFPAAEAMFAKNVNLAFNYAKYVLKGPFPEGEEVIANDAEHAYRYAEDVLKGPFPKGEAAIAKDAVYSNLYDKKAYIKRRAVTPKKTSSQMSN